jgi:hypothetical protein
MSRCTKQKVAMMIIIAAYCNYGRLGRHGLASPSEAFVGLFRPRLFLALFRVGLMLFQIRWCCLF